MSDIPEACRKNSPSDALHRCIKSFGKGVGRDFYKSPSPQKAPFAAANRSEQKKTAGPEKVSGLLVCKGYLDRTPIIDSSSNWRL